MSVKLRSKKVIDGSHSLYLDIYLNGKRHYEFLNIYLKQGSSDYKANKMLAESIAAKRQLEIQNNEHGFIPQFKSKVNFIEYFEKAAKQKNLYSSVWQPTVLHLKDFAGSSVPFSAINEKWLEQLKAYLLTKVSPNSARVYFAKVKTILNIAVKEKLILQNPANAVEQIKRVETQMSFLTEEEVRKLAMTPCKDPRVSNAFLFSCFSGLRLSDVQALTWENIEGKHVRFRQKKTKSVEYMPLPESALKILQNVSTVNGERVIQLKTNKVFQLGDRSCVRLRIKQWAKDAGITKNISYHTSRHTCGTMYVSMGVDLYTVSKMLGHKTIATTQIYAKVIDTKKQDAANSLPMIEIAI